MHMNMPCIEAAKISTAQGSVLQGSVDSTGLHNKPLSPSPCLPELEGVGVGGRLDRPLCPMQTSRRCPRNFLPTRDVPLTTENGESAREMERRRVAGNEKRENKEEAAVGERMDRTASTQESRARVCGKE